MKNILNFKSRLIRNSATTKELRKQIINTCKNTKNYDVVIGPEVDVYVLPLVMKANNVFLFDENERYGYLGDEGISMISSKQPSLLDQKGEFSSIVRFVGFCRECHHNIYLEAKVIAKKMALQSNIITMFWNQGIEDHEIFVGNGVWIKCPKRRYFYK